jgi:hypothetical protein
MVQGRFCEEPLFLIGSLSALAVALFSLYAPTMIPHCPPLQP